MDIFGRKQIALLQTQLSDLQEENRDLSIQFKSRADLAQSLTEKNSDLELRLKALEQELSKQKSSTTSQSNSLLKEISELKKEIKQVQDQKVKLEKSVNDLKTEKDKRGQEIKTLNERINAEKKKFQDLESLVKSKENEVSSIKTGRDSALKELEEKTMVFEQLAKEREDAYKQVKEAKRELNEEKKKAGQVESVKNELSECKDQLEKGKKEFLNEKKHLEQQVADKSQEVVREKEIVVKVRTELEAGKTELAKVRGELESNRTHFHKEKENLEQALKSAEKKLAEANSKLAEIQSSKHSTAELLEELNSKLKLTSDELALLKVGKAHVEAQLKACQDNLEALQERNSKVEAELVTLAQIKTELEENDIKNKAINEAAEKNNLRLESKMMKETAKLIATEKQVKELEEKVRVLGESQDSLMQLENALVELKNENEVLKGRLLHNIKEKSDWSSWYDGKLEICQASDLENNEKGWRLILSDPSLSTAQSYITCSLVGKYKSGKSFILSNLSHSPQQLIQETEHLSFKKSSSNLLFIDSVGTNSHFRSKHFSKSENNVYEHLIQEILFYLSNHVIFVVNGFTSKEQSRLKSWTRKIKEHKGPDEPKYIILVHNLQAASTGFQYKQAWENQVVNALQVSESIVQKTKQIELNLNGTASTREVDYIKKHHVIHCSLLDNDSEYGALHNLFTFEFIRSRLTQKSEPKSVNLLEKLTHIIKSITNEPNISVSEVDSVSLFNRILVHPEHPEHFKSKLVQLVKIKGFEPAFEVLEQHGRYSIVLDVPGLTEQDIKLECEDRKVWISGVRKGHEEGMKGFGEFSCKFRIPKHFNHSPEKVTVQNGVMSLNFVQNNS